MSDDAARTADGRLFHARGAATENDRSPRVGVSVVRDDRGRPPPAVRSTIIT